MRMLMRHQEHARADEGDGEEEVAVDEGFEDSNGEGDGEGEAMDEELDEEDMDEEMDELSENSQRSNQ